ncbi:MULTISPECIES: chaperone NapD [Stutzerimonas stutzeri subgroup]|uniref:Chaperone NapD n=1 Tax=Stutzerimonas stutzeri TaxID=316 RepID=A0A2N8RBC9_STUST|nr:MULTISPECIES: chaperone NapD [Stutzerimonas stutzeri subgroup]KRW70850.1 glutamate synthase [Pseudomonas sp. TTU2014-105ASC]MDH2243535.1 chaperone NapD [Pseudomonas sp. GD03909]MDH2248153.1 chaperone NapD [Pseudomonas sp. GD03856]MDH2266943.1 chaperone NapD [Pseudomonas sp. GD03855]MBA1237573.1 chaperone NapD [Stutzerimonas kunmingensis]
MEHPLHIASLLVHCRPELLTAIKANLRLLPGLELHQENANGKLVVVLEAEHESRILSAIDHIQHLPGVLNAALIYHEELLEGDA